MAKITYALSLLRRSDSSPVPGFSVFVHAWSDGRLLFEETRLHDGTGAPLPVELDAVQPPANGIAKLTLRGPATGVEGDPVTYETYVVLRRRTGGEIRLWFEECPRIDRPGAAAVAPAANVVAPGASDPDSGEAFAELFMARDAADNGIGGAEDRLYALLGRNNLNRASLKKDWYGLSELSCRTLYVRIDDQGGPALPDASAQIVYPGASYPLSDPKPLSHDIRRPTLFHARAREGGVRLEIRDSSDPGDVLAPWIDISRSETQEVVLLPRKAPRPVPARHTKLIDAPAMIEHVYVDGTPRGKVATRFIRHGLGDRYHSSLAASIWRECEKHARNWILRNVPDAQEPRMISLWSRSFLTFEVAENGDYRWSAFRWTEENGRGRLIDQDVPVDRLYIEWVA